MRLLSIVSLAILLALPTLARGEYGKAKCDRGAQAAQSDENQGDDSQADDEQSSADDQAAAETPAGDEADCCADEEGCAAADSVQVADASDDDADCAAQGNCLEIRIEHALEAAEHLQAAGLEDLTAEVSQQIQTLRAELLEQKLAQLEQLQAEIAELRLATGQAQQVVVNLEIVEVSLTKLRELGCDFAGIQGKCEGQECDACPGRQSVCPQVCQRECIAALLESLRKEHVAKILASPSLVTVDGRAASCIIGGEIPTPVVHADDSVGIEYRPFGTQVDLVTRLLGAGKVRLDLRPRCSEIDPSQTVTVGGVSVPAMRVREIETGFDMELGQTAVLAGAVQEHSRSVIDRKTNELSTTHDEVQTIFLVTPQLVDAQDPQEEVETARAPGAQSR